MTRTHSRNGGLSSLSEREKQTVFECLRAASDGPFFPDWEFPTLFGLERDQVRRIVAAIPHIDDSSEEVALAINNAMVNLFGYPHHQEAVGRSSFRYQRKKSAEFSRSGEATRSSNHAMERTA